VDLAVKNPEIVAHPIAPLRTPGPRPSPTVPRIPYPAFHLREHRPPPPRGRAGAAPRWWPGMRRRAARSRISGGRPDRSPQPERGSPCVVPIC
jgi:hypothetical protein